MADWQSPACAPRHRAERQRLCSKRRLRTPSRSGTAGPVPAKRSDAWPSGSTSHARHRSTPARPLAGARVAGLTKTGGWASHVLLDAADVVGVPEGVGAAEAETAVVNGITAWQILHRKARVRTGGTILVHGANSGVGSILVQLALNAGVRVIGTASARHHDALRALGVTPVDYRTENVPARIRELAPGGMDAVFDRGRARPDRLLAAGRPRRHPRVRTAAPPPVTTPAPSSGRPQDAGPCLTVERPAQRPSRLLLQHLGRPGPVQEPLPRPPARRPHPGPHGSAGRRHHRCRGRRTPSRSSRRGHAPGRVRHGQRQGRPRPVAAALPALAPSSLLRRRSTMPATLQRRPRPQRHTRDVPLVRKDGDRSADGDTDVGILTAKDGHGLNVSLVPLVRIGGAPWRGRSSIQTLPGRLTAKGGVRACAPQPRTD